ncbi:FecR family protein [Paraflavitalea speifideaquila]|uniref:FecR family protein n=1 Tax=Paraflavitalea speifideaquila TaxID=3076558 RepID=UPI0028E37BD4|nr:FecR domain-containing protein [Paraflavitalea speifideiaquila]
MNSDPALGPLVAEAKEYMAALSIQELEVPAGQVAAAEQRLMTHLSVETTAPVIPLRRRTSRWWWAAAAILVIGVGASLWLYRSAPAAQLHTAYGEIRKQQLPDGSTVMLNANSEISYHEGWQEGTSREIWLKGEAFFHVAKTPAKTRFIVHTDRFDIVVTGTQFNVMNRAGKTNVMLTEGSIILKPRDGKDIYMKPGDFVEFNDKDHKLITAREENILAWKDKKLFFEKTPLRTAIQKIEELYGVKISLANERIGDKPISGIMMNDNLDVLLQALEATTDFHVVRNNNEILITE